MRDGENRNLEPHSTGSTPSHDYTKAAFRRLHEQHAQEMHQQAEYTRTHEMPTAQDILRAVDLSSLDRSMPLTSQSVLKKTRTLAQVMDTIKALDGAQLAGYRATSESVTNPLGRYSVTNSLGRYLDRTSAVDSSLVKTAQKAEPGHEKYWRELGYGESQARRNAKGAREFLRQVQQVEQGQAQGKAKAAREFLRQAQQSKNLAVFWASFGAMKALDNYKVDEKWRTPNPKIAKKALGEYNSFYSKSIAFREFIASRTSKEFDLGKFSKDFIAYRKHYSFQDSFKFASDRALAQLDAENEPPQPPTRKPPRDGDGPAPFFPFL